MQIHEITIKKNTQVNEGVFDTVGSLAGDAVSGAKTVGSAIAAPFKDVAQGYSTARQDQKVSAVADKAFRAWQKYVPQLEQSIAVQPAPAKTTPAPTTSSTGGQTQTTDTGLTHKANPNNPNNTATTSSATTTQSADATARGEQNKGFGFNKNTGVAFNSQAEKDAVKAQAGNAPVATTPPATTKPNYGAQTGAGANITYKQSTGGIPNTPKVTSTNMMQPPATPPATVGSTAKGQPITVGGQTIKPGQPGYDELAKATLKELQEPVSPALTAFRDRTDGKYEAYLTAFVQKNLLAGMGFKGLVNQQEITNAIKAIAAPANADPAKQRPLWNDLARAAALAVPSAGALTGRDGKAPKDPNATKDPNAPGEVPPTDPNAPDEEPAQNAEPAKPTMTRAQIRQWISRNSEDHAVLKAALDAINAIKVNQK